jgi:hypothetical protein
VLFGYDGPYEATGLGLVGDTGEDGTVDQDPDQSFSGCSTPLGDGEVAHAIDLSGSAHLRITMGQNDVDGPADTDIDLFLCLGNSLVAASTAPATNEVINLSQPADGNYTLFVHGWSVPTGSVDYTFHLWDVPLAGGGSLVVDSAPTSASIGATGTIEFSWSGATGTSMGAIAHSDASDLLGLTLVTITE